MTKFNKVCLLLIIVTLISVLTGCARKKNAGDYYYSDSRMEPATLESGEDYLEINENEFIKTSKDAVSTFSLDTSTAGYANLRRLINNNSNITKNQVKLEEMVNYFKYDYSSPTGEDDLAISSEIMTCPWNTNNKIVSIGVKAKDIVVNDSKFNNLVFLLDVSGSMDSPNKLPLMQEAFKLFAETLNDNDTLSIVTYAGSNEVRLDVQKDMRKSASLTLLRI